MVNLILTYYYLHVGRNSETVILLYFYHKFMVPMGRRHCQ
jgi:hypothetical protein